MLTKRERKILDAAFNLGITALADRMEAAIQEALETNSLKAFKEAANDIENYGKQFRAVLDSLTDDNLE